MNGDPDGSALAAALGHRLDRLAFRQLTADRVTATIIDEIAGWAAEQGWRVYRRAPSVVPLPPPMQRQFSVLDVACARPDGPPVGVEVDHSDRQRTVDKLRAEAAAGRLPIWVRWGPGGFTAPGPPVHLVTVEVTREPGRLFSRVPGGHRPPPEHSAGATGEAVALPIFPAADG
jgi:hypothetical protein